MIQKHADVCNDPREWGENNTDQILLFGPGNVSSYCKAIREKAFPPNQPAPS